MYPDAGELFKSKKNTKKSSDHLVFFVHFFKGNKKILKRHIDFVNELGFDAYAFNLKDSMSDYSYFPLSQSKKFGLKHVLADQIQMHLDLLPEYKNKIVFSFSNVSACAMEAIVHRIEDEHGDDIKAMVCDSGPGTDVLSSSYNLIKHQLKVKSLISRLVRSPFFALGWSPLLNKDVYQDLSKFPKNFPILSIRGWRDQLISHQSIDQIFKPHTQLKWRKLNLPEAGHVNGLRDFPSEYKPAVEDFLSYVTTK
jgi:hypothetical protein